MFCANCGLNIDDTLKFCPSCGAPTANAATTASADSGTPSAPDLPKATRKKTEIPKWLPWLAGVIALLALARACAPDAPTPSPKQTPSVPVETATTVPLPQADRPSTDAVNRILTATVARDRPTLPREVDEYTTHYAVEVIDGNRLRMDYRTNSPHAPIETSQLIQGIMREQTIAKDCSIRDRRDVLDLGGEFEYRYFNGDGSHEYGRFIVNKASCAAQSSSATSP